VCLKLFLHIFEFPATNHSILIRPLAYLIGNGPIVKIVFFYRFSPDCVQILHNANSSLFAEFVPIKNQQNLSRHSHDCNPTKRNLLSFPRMLRQAPKCRNDLTDIPNPSRSEGLCYERIRLRSDINRTFPIIEDNNPTFSFLCRSAVVGMCDFFSDRKIAIFCDLAELSQIIGIFATNRDLSPR